MSHSVTGHTAGRTSARSILTRRLAQLAIIVAYATAGWTTGARAAPPAPSPWDVAFGCATTSDYNFRGITQSNRCVHPFVAVEAGYGWNNTNFDVMPSFDARGTGFNFGLNAGVLIDIPGTSISLGPRIGWLGGNVPGSIANPPASPGFIYDVKTLWTFYQEAVVQFPVPIGGPVRSPVLFPFITASVGIAEVKTQVTGTSGGFQVTDSVTRTGLTFTGGFGVPIAQSIDATAIDLYLQYRAVVLPSTDVNIPGKVSTDYWAQGIDFGLRFRY